MIVKLKFQARFSRKLKLFTSSLHFCYFSFTIMKLHHAVPLHLPGSWDLQTWLNNPCLKWLISRMKLLILDHCAHLDLCRWCISICKSNPIPTASSATFAKYIQTSKLDPRPMLKGLFSQLTLQSKTIISIQFCLKKRKF